MFRKIVTLKISNEKHSNEKHMSQFKIRMLIKLIKLLL
jgi:hypothetical protein